MFYRRITIVTAVMSFFFVICASAGADFINDISRDFKPLPGYVLQRNGAKLIVAVDDLKAVSNGDLFTILTPGKEVIHPITKKVLGRLEKVKAVIRIQSIKPGFAFAQFVGKPDHISDIKRGDPIGRYGNMVAIFWDYTGEGKELYNQLLSALPNLEWQSYDQAQKSKPPELGQPSENNKAVYFILKPSLVEVRDPDFALLHRYEYLGVAASPIKTRVLLPVATPKKIVPEGKPVGAITHVTQMADFVYYQGKLLMAATDGKDIQIFKVGEKLVPVAKLSCDDYLQILSLKWWYPEEKGPLYLTLNSWSIDQVVGRVLAFDGHTLRSVGGEMSKILGTFDLDGDQRHETLLGQDFDEDAFFGTRKYELKLIGGKMRYSSPPLSLPWKFRVTGSLLGDLTGDGRLESIFVQNGILYIYRGEKLVATSAKQVGGSLSSLTYDVEPDAEALVKPTPTVFFEVPPVLSDVDGDGRPELITISSDRSSLALPGFGLGIKRSWLSKFKLEDGRLVQNKIDKELDGAIQGLAVFDKRIWILLTTPDALIFGGKGGDSQLYEWRDK